MWTRRSFLTSTIALTSLAGALPARAASTSTSPSPAADLTLRLPAPAGPHRLGVRTLHLTDRGRVDPWNGSPDRELVLTVFYPARTTRGCHRAPQMTARAAGNFKGFAAYYHHLPAGVDWSATLTHSYADAPPAPGRRPVLLYSPGGTDPRTLGTGLAEDLASHGYVVVTIDHPGETSEVDIPDGELRTIQIPPTTPTDPVLSRLMMSTRFADVRFVLSRLSTLGLPLDLRRIGIYGHSAGGSTAAQALYENRELKSAINLEGYLDYLPLPPGEPDELYPIAQHGSDRPLLLAGTDGFRDARFDSSWSALLAHHGPVRRTEIAHANHWVFTDLGAMAPQLQAAGLMTAEDRTDQVGAVNPAISVPLIRRTVRSFFDRTLKR
ncbi:alpha/beta hydrolase [Kribbella sp. NPDC051718]|uniref:alpha/beta hydrolase family protein n=1 Tax=Kribbella sp. NPDC051718 TaxID=3155168 RepID=UPI003414201C